MTELQYKLTFGINLVTLSLNSIATLYILVQSKLKLDKEAIMLLLLSEASFIIKFGIVA